MKRAAMIHAWVHTTVAALIISEAGSQSVRLTFYDVDLESWNEHSDTETLRQTLAENANVFCKNSFTACGLYQWLPLAVFRAGDVIVTDGYPAEVKSNLVVEVKVQMHPGMNVSVPDQIYLRTVILKDIVLKSRDSLRESTRTWIIYLDKEHLGRPPPARLNEIIIPISFAVLLAIIILAISLHCWRKRKDAREKKESHKLGKTVGKSRVSPNHVAPNQPSSTDMIHPPSRQLRSNDRSLASDNTATPSNVSMTTDIVNEGRTHKKRHRKKKRQVQENTENQNETGFNYNRVDETGDFNDDFGRNPALRLN